MYITPSTTTGTLSSRPRSRDMVNPFRHQRMHVRRVDLLEEAVPLRIVGAVVAQPVSGIDFQQFRISHLGSGGGEAKYAGDNRSLMRAAEQREERT